MMKVAAVILTKNEEARIEECLQHLRPYINFIFVLDGDSEDKTVEIAEKYADKVMVMPFSGSFADDKNFARTQVPKDCEWILWVDADERFDKGFLQHLPDHILAVTAMPVPAVCFRFARCNLPDGKDFPDYQVRLIRNSRDIEWRGDVHEVPYFKPQGIPLDHIDSGMKGLAVITVDAFPIIHLPRREDEKRSWW